MLKKYNYRLYSSDNTNTNLQEMEINTSSIKIISLTTEVKEETIQEFGNIYPGLTEILSNPDLYQVNKNKSLFSLNGDSKTARELMIEITMKRRLIDDNYWIKKTCEKLNPEENYFIPEFRYKCSYDYLYKLFGDKAKTIRLVRIEVEIPSMEETSEHELDNFTTDFLITDGFYYSTSLFLQYENYVDIN